MKAAQEYGIHFATAPEMGLCLGCKLLGVGAVEAEEGRGPGTGQEMDLWSMLDTETKELETLRATENGIVGAAQVRPLESEAGIVLAALEKLLANRIESLMAARERRRARQPVDLL